ncbi:secreted protein [methanotrophic bacterial endosymbiont of Bathymodiolus sp.]|nr:secreted protein [methanotrophic bacterial endosymbiont of Bathymodiolus sp.]
MTSISIDKGKRKSFSTALVFLYSSSFIFAALYLLNLSLS